MQFKKMPQQYQLVHAISKDLFLNANFKCVVIVSKTPYLMALIACHGAKLEVLPPYLPGTCILLPVEDRSKEYFHAVLEETEYFNGEKFYWYKFRNARRNSTCGPGRNAKPCTYIERNAKVFPNMVLEEWLGKRNIGSDDLILMDNSIFPAIIGHQSKGKVDYWKKIDLGLREYPLLTMSKVLNISFDNKHLNTLNTFSSKVFDSKFYKNQIWVNDVPRNKSEGRFLIVLSPSHSNFMDLVFQVNNFYSENKLIAVKQEEIPKGLKELGITNKSLLLASLMKELN